MPKTVKCPLPTNLITNWAKWLRHIRLASNPPMKGTDEDRGHVFNNKIYRYINIIFGNTQLRKIVAYFSSIISAAFSKVFVEIIVHDS